jgi:LacI family repressor for deo operon, udp, cdd, tsx, nupC, and nupG
VEQVATAAGVSVSTVSRALRSVPGTAPATVQRVKQAAARLGYVPSVSGSRLATGKTGSIALIVPSAAKWFFGEVIAGAGEVIRSAGLDVLLFELGDAAGRRRFFEEQRLRGRADAVLVLSLELNPAEAEMLEHLNLPVARLGAAHGAPARIGVDDAEGAATAVRHLIELGHHEIGLIGIDNSADVTAGSLPPAQRRMGYHRAMREAGLPLRPDHEVLAENSVTGGRVGASALLGGTTVPSAVFAASDEIAFGALRTFRERGLSVPREISLVGFDNHEFADVVGLTTMDQNVRLQGASAARNLLDQLLTGTTAGAACLPTRLVIRNSTAAPSR